MYDVSSVPKIMSQIDTSASYDDTNDNASKKYLACCIDITDVLFQQNKAPVTNSAKDISLSNFIQCCRLQWTHLKQPQLISLVFVFLQCILSILKLLATMLFYQIATSVIKIIKESPQKIEVQLYQLCSCQRKGSCIGLNIS